MIPEMCFRREHPPPLTCSFTLPRSPTPSTSLLDSVRSVFPLIILLSVSWQRQETHFRASAPLTWRSASVLPTMERRDAPFQRFSNLGHQNHFQCVFACVCAACARHSFGKTEIGNSSGEVHKWTPRQKYLTWHTWWNVSQIRSICFTCPSGRRDVIGWMSELFKADQSDFYQWNLLVTAWGFLLVWGMILELN